MVEEGTAKLLEILGLVPPVSFTTVQMAFRDMAKQHHPDHGGDSEQFQEILLSYRALQDRSRRGEFLAEEKEQRTVGGIPLAELGKGLGPKINGRPCSRCAGKGYTTEHLVGRLVDCPTCHGVGEINEVVCNRCQGTKQNLKGEPCPVCKGSGVYHLPHPKMCPTCVPKNAIRRKTSRTWFYYFGEYLWEMPDGTPVYPGQVRASSDVLYYPCSECRGAGEVRVWNPVLPKGRLFQGGKE